MKATWNNTVVAESPNDRLIKIEGNWYFPPSSVKREFFKENDMHTTCPWKGEASYFDVIVDGNSNEAAAWYYPTPLQGGLDRVGHDFTDYVAFWHGINVTE